MIITCDASKPISFLYANMILVWGYLALHISGVAWGHEIFSKPKTAIGHYKQDAIKLMQWVFLMWASLYSSINLQVGIILFSSIITMYIEYG